MTNPQSLIHPLVRELHPCVYGDQPKIKGLIKLNANENPYPPSPKMLAAVKAAVDGRLGSITSATGLAAVAAAISAVVPTIPPPAKPCRSSLST